MSLIGAGSPRETEKSTAIKAIIEGSAPYRQFYILVALSVCLATLGILMQNDTVVIGSMLIAPLLYPILSVSLGLATVDRDLILRSLVIVSKSVALGLVVSVGLSLVFFTRDNFATVEYLIDNLTPSYAHFAVGVVAGLAAAFALTKENLANAIPGVAIAVALIPPLAAIGVSLALLDPSLIINSAILFLSNMFGIIVATTILFFTMNFKTQGRSIDKSLQKQEIDLDN